jgi:hypothetical protein
VFSTKKSPALDGDAGFGDYLPSIKESPMKIYQRKALKQDQHSDEDNDNGEDKVSSDSGMPKE